LESRYDVARIYALASLTLGLGSFVAWVFPAPFGVHLLSSSVGLWLGLLSIRSTHRGMALTGSSICGMVFGVDMLNYISHNLFV